MVAYTDIISDKQIRNNRLDIVVFGKSSREAAIIDDIAKVRMEKVTGFDKRYTRIILTKGSECHTNYNFGKRTGGKESCNISLGRERPKNECYLKKL